MSRAAHPLLVLAGALLALAMALAFALAAGADEVKKASGPPKAFAGTPLAGVILPIDRVQIIDFTGSPASPTVGQRVTLTVTVRNLTNAALDVPWSIRNIEQGTVRVGPNADAVVTAHWAPNNRGGMFLEAEIDSGNTLNEPQHARQNNKRGLSPYVQPFVITLKPDFFTAGPGGLFHLENCALVLQTSGPARFDPSDELRAFGVSAQTVPLPTVDEDREEVIRTVRKYDVAPCAQWLAADPRRAGKECPYHRDDPVSAKYHLKLDMNDLQANHTGIAATFEGTNLILNIRFEEAGKELTGTVSKRIVGEADVSTRITGEMSNITMKITFALSAVGGALVVQYSSLDFASDVSMDASGHDVPQWLVDRMRIRNRFVGEVKAKADAALRTSAFAGGLKAALGQFLGTVGMRTITAVRAGSHGGADVEGRR